jgi:hypothetical protein
MSTGVLAGKEKVAGAERTGTFGTAGIISALCHIASNITTGFRWLGLPVPDLYSIRRWTSRLRDLCGWSPRESPLGKFRRPSLLYTIDAYLR